MNNTARNEALLNGASSDYRSKPSYVSSVQNTELEHILRTPTTFINKDSQLNNGAEVATTLRMVQGSNHGTGKTFFLFFKTTRQALGHIHSPLQLVQQFNPPPPAAIRPGCDVGHSPPSSAEVNNEWNHTSIPLYAFMVWTGTTSHFCK